MRPLLLCIAYCALSNSALAERLPLTVERATKEATHIVTGKVNAIYSRLVRLKEGRVELHHLVEIEVDSVEKGDSLKAHDFVYARCWQLTDHGSRGPEPGPSGHSLAKEGEAIRAFLVRGKYGATGQSDNGFAAVYPNGLQLIDKK